MKLSTQLKIAGLSLVVVALGSFAMADVSVTGFGNNHIQSPLYEIDESPSGSALRFNYSQNGDQSSLGTCTMNPMSSNAVEAIIEELPVKEPDTNIAVQDYGHAMSQPTTPAPPTVPQRRYPDDDPPPPQVNVPEPASMLILGLGLAGAIPFVRRFKHKRQS